MIEKVKIMYDLMVERFESSPHGRNQAEAYRKVRALADECSSVAEMTARLQNEGYNKLPAIALITDKVEAHRLAAIENGLKEHADIYDQVLDDIKDNPDNAYLTGFYDDISRADKRYAKTIERLMGCFNDYLYFKVKNEKSANAHIVFNEWEKEGVDFKEIVYKKAFRSHFACSDEFLELFINEYEMFIAGKLLGTPKVEKNEIEKVFKDIKQHKDQLRLVAKTELPRYRRASAMSIAPNSSEGDYEYVNIEFDD